VAANTAQFDGGGILGEAGTVILRNTLVSANSSQRRSDVSPDGGSIVALYTLIHTTLHGAGGTPVPVDAATGTLPVTLAQVGLGALGAHGGPTTTHPLLLTGSPALDAVPAGQCTEVTEDQRGVARPQMGACDLGAYELVPTSDATPPVITPTVTGTLGNGGWYTGNVTVAWTVSDDGSAITARTGCDPITITTDTPGLTLTCRATSVGGTSQQGVTVKRDATAPTLAPTVAPAVVLLNGTATAAAGAADATSGVTLAACDPAATTTVGARTVRCTATDAAGNTAAATAPYTVTYRFAGFEAPVANGGTLNLARAGLVIPLRWRLTDAAGAPVTTLTAAAVATAPILCPNGGGTNNIKTGASRRRPCATWATGVYQLDWQSPRDLANGCHTLRLDLGEGVARTALFRFSR
jgi:hypothetical protein